MRTWFFYYLWYSFLSSPLGMFALAVLMLLVCGCVMGVVDFRGKKKLRTEEAKPDDLDREDRLHSIRHFLEEEFGQEFEVSHFDGAYQVFTRADSELSNEDLYRKLRMRFPQGVFSMHRTLGQ